MNPIESALIELLAAANTLCANSRESNIRGCETLSFVSNKDIKALKQAVARGYTACGMHSQNTEEA